MHLKGIFWRISNIRLMGVMNAVMEKDDSRTDVQKALDDEKSGRSGAILLGVVFFLVLVFVISQLINTSTSNGDNVKSISSAAGKLGFEISSVQTKQELNGGLFDKKETNEQFLVLKLSISNRDSRARDLSPTLFTLQDEDGRKYEFVSMASDKYLKSETVNPGITRTGLLAFEIPKGVKGLKLKAKSGILLAGGESTFIDLSPFLSGK